MVVGKGSGGKGRGNEIKLHSLAVRRRGLHGPGLALREDALSIPSSH